jgi:hypothetical protein
MNERTDRKELLADVLADASDAGFREALLARTLHLARRRRRFRQARPICGLLLMLVVIGVVISRVASWRPTNRPSPVVNYNLVKTQPFSADHIVATRPFASLQTIASATIASVVRTQPGDATVREISDDELLALAPQPAALIRRGPHEMELVVVRQENQDELPLN